MKIFFYFLLVLLLFSCEKEVKEISPQPVESQKTDILEFTTLGKGVLTGAGQEGFVKQGITIKTQGQYDTLLADMSKLNNVKATISDTILDFNHFQVVAVFSNIKMSGGYAVEVKNIKDSVSAIVVNIKEESGGAGADAQYLTQPYHLVKMIKSEKEISFNWEE
jgi:hypothetical protein